MGDKELRPDRDTRTDAGTGRIRLLWEVSTQRTISHQMAALTTCGGPADPGASHGIATRSMFRPLKDRGEVQILLTSGLGKTTTDEDPRNSSEATMAISTTQGHRR